MQNFFYVVTKFHGFFEQVQPDYIIYLSRDDTLKQAISYSRALQTHAWFHDVVDSVDATYDFNHITQCFDVLKSQNEYWEEVFKMANVIPIRIKYEDFVESPSSVIARVAEKMNLQIDESKMLDIPLLERQSDPITTQWKLKYLEDSENK
jgi:LPS sulfotransferase NodH